MKIKELTQELCRREGKKRQVNVAQMSEVVKCLADILHEEGDCGRTQTLAALEKSASRRAK